MMADNSDLVQALRNLVTGELDTVNTALPCTVISYSNGRVTVKPDTEKHYEDGDTNSYPVLSDLRMQWPQFAGGRAGLKGPVMPGDQCMLIVCQQAIDGSDDTRRFDIIDSYVIPGTGYSDAIPGNDDMRIYYGNAFIAIDDTGKIKINAPGGIEETTPLHAVKGRIDVTDDVVIDGIKMLKHHHRGDSGGATGEPEN